LISNADGEIDETAFIPASADQLTIFPDKQLPEGALHTMEDIYVALCVKR